MAEEQQSLEQQYEKVISEQRDYLSRLQTAFNGHCDEIAKKTAERLKDIPENDKETRKKIYLEQKSELDESLKKLKNEIDKSSTETRKKLEEITLKREEREIKELEDMIQHLE